MFAEGDLLGSTPATFEILLSGFQSDAHLNPSLGAEVGSQRGQPASRHQVLEERGPAS